MEILIILVPLSVLAILIALLVTSTRSQESNKSDKAEPTIQKIPERQKWPYVKRTYLMNWTEYEFFKALRSAVDGRYLVFAQVNISRLIDVESGKLKWERRKYWSKIDRLSVDYVLCEPGGVRPVLAIELDGSGHWMKDRSERDEFVKQIFEDVGLKFMRLRPQKQYSSDELRQQIDGVIR